MNKLIQLAVYSTLLLIVGANVNGEGSDEFDDGIVEEIQEDNTSPDGTEHIYESPEYDPKEFHFVDHFDNVPESSKRWIKSQAKKDDIAEEEIAKYDGRWDWESPQRIVWKNDIGLVLKSKAKHAAISSYLHKEFVFNNGKPLVVQYEVTMQEGQDCGGSYIKLLSAGKHTQDLTKFNDKTPYTIMFGPDKCGNDIKMHFIFRHVNPINGSVSEKHCRKPKDRLEEPFKDKLPHLYQLIVRPDNSFEIRVDHKIVNDGSLLTEFTPPVNPPREIDDPEDKKPADWDEREKIADPTAHKPEDWNDEAPPQIPDPTAIMPEGWLEDEPEMIPDTVANKPEDWDTEIDGEWEAPLVDNPVCEKAVGCGKWKAPLVPNKEYKGKWRAPLIDNPNYQGKWTARKIANPDFFEDLNPFKMMPISAVGIELWSMSSEILFDNLVITDDPDVAKDFAAKTFDIKRKYIDKESKTLWHRLMKYMNYKPGWWALYFLYLLIPASCYVCYLYRRAKEVSEFDYIVYTVARTYVLSSLELFAESVLNKLINYGTENPWAWRIAIVLIGAPLAFSLYRLCSKGDSKKETDADAKKTDAVQPDDETAEELVEGITNKKTKQSSPKKKSDLDFKDKPVEDNPTPKDTDSDENNEAETEEATTTSTPSATRKRVRKDLS